MNSVNRLGVLQLMRKEEQKRINNLYYNYLAFNKLL